MDGLGWMAWTWPTAIFFGFIALCLVLLSVLAAKRPETPKLGTLGFPTTRGDRFFVSLLVTAYVCIAWIRLGVGEVLWWPLAIAAALSVLIFRFV
jgi:predicted small integral membrane protein